MAYCTQQDILEQLDEDSLIQLTDDVGTGFLDGAKVDRAIADADATIDAYCRSRYNVPFSPVPQKVRAISVDIAIYNLYSRRMGAPDHRKDRYDAAIRFLEKVAEGKARFDGEPPAQTSTATEVRVDSNDRIFGRGDLEGF